MMNNEDIKFKAWVLPDIIKWMKENYSQNDKSFLELFPGMFGVKSICFFDSNREVSNLITLDYWVDYYHDLEIPFELCRLLRFTGLQDRNGKDIYESDIIERRWDDDDPSAGRDRGDICEVIFAEGCWVLKDISSDLIDSLGDNLLYENDPMDLEVIGNIYENPELLNEVDNET